MNSRERFRDGHPIAISGLGTFGALYKSVFAIVVLIAVAGSAPSGLCAAVQTHTNAAPGTITNSTPIPTTEITAQAESDISGLRTIETESSSDAGVDLVESQLPLISDEIDNRSDEDARVLARSRSLDLFA